MHSVARLDSNNAPYVVRNEFFGGLVYVRDKGEYLAFDKDVINVLRSSLTKPLDDVFAEVYGERNANAGIGDLTSDKDYRKDFDQLIRCFESGPNPLMREGRFLGVFLDNRVPPNCHSLTAPTEVHFQLTNYCQYSCKHCWIKRDGVPNNQLDTARVKSLFSHLASCGVFIVHLGGGQAVERSDFEEIADYAHKLGIRLNLSTNVSSLVDKNTAKLAHAHIHEFKVGIAAGTEKTWNGVRGTQSFRQFKRGLARLVKAVNDSEQQSRIVFNAVIFEENREDVSSIIRLVNKLASEHNLDNPVLRLSCALPIPNDYNYSEKGRYLSLERVQEIVEKVEEYSRTRTKGDLVTIVTNAMVPPRVVKRHTVEGFGCRCGQMSCYVSANGYVYPSGLLSTLVAPEDSINLRKRSLVDIWQQAPLFRGYRNLSGNEICRKCDHLNYCHGGCRSRAFLVTKNRSAVDPWCVHFKKGK